jgi:hypothetical protein
MYSFIPGEAKDSPGMTIIVEVGKQFIGRRIPSRFAVAQAESVLTCTPKTHDRDVF